LDTPRRPRLRLFALLVAALAIVSLTPLLVTDRVLIGLNRESLETMEKKYTARSASAIAELIDLPARARSSSTRSPTR
jgi:hypothetical protein